MPWLFFLFSRNVYNWNHMLYSFFRLALLTNQYAFKFHPCIFIVWHILFLSLYIISLYGCVNLSYINILRNILVASSLGLLRITFSPHADICEHEYSTHFWAWFLDCGKTIFSLVTNSLNVFQCGFTIFHSSSNDGEFLILCMSLSAL